jgi:uncharacterized beta-barrel protein YwiB (DUF1934 family)
MKDVIIDIKGTQTVQGEDDVIELTTVGKMNIIGEKTYLKYDDSAMSGADGVSCIIKVDQKDNSVVMQRSGGLNSRMFIKKGQRHICHYETGQGTFTMGIFGEEVKSDLDSNGGSLVMSYTIDVNYGMLSRNKVEINVKQV